ncbi:MAG: glycoside hydrolase family 2 protein, partial [Acidobacteriota bacterium]
DTHYWQVWHAEKPYEEYEKQFPRFMSEYGFQSFPELETVKTYTTEDDRTSIETPIMLAHQRHPRGNQLVRQYMMREYDQPKDFESFLYVSQVLQAQGIKIGAEHLRRIMPRNMGSLYWQANDCWQVASWSAMDYFGRWKALMYYTRRFYAPMLVSPHVEDGKMEIFVVSDSPTAKGADLNIRLIDLGGRELMTKSVSLSIEPLKGKSYLSVPVNELLDGADPKSVVLLAELRSGGKTVSTNQYYFKPFKEMAFSKPNIAVDVSPSANGFKIKLTSDKVAKAVYLSGFTDGFFVDNYFDLIPGKAVEVEFKTDKKMSVDEFRRSFNVRSLVDAFN